MQKPDFFSYDSLLNAWEIIRKKKAHGGIDGQTVKSYEEHIQAILQDLSLELVSDRYVPEPYLRIYLKKSNKEKRPLGLPTIKDKIVQMAVRNAIEPIFNAEFLDCSYAYRPGKGHRKAIRRVEHELRTGHVWIANCDIDNFFDTVHHSILLKQVREKIADSKILRLIELWLKIGVVQNGMYKSIQQGIPQGGVISPLLSNIYLHSFDRFMILSHFHLVRYADDFLILEKSEKRALDGYRKSKHFLENELRLRINPSERPCDHIKSGFVFLGIQFKGYKRIISPKKFDRAVSKIESIEHEMRVKRFEEIIEDLNEKIRSWEYYYGTGDTRPQFRILEQKIQYQLAKALKHKLTIGEIDSKKDAVSSLNKLRSLIPKKAAEKRWFIRQIIKGFKPGTVSSVSNGNRKDAVHFEKRSVEKAVYYKKRKYQREQAKSIDLIVSRPGQNIGKLKGRIVVRKNGKIVYQIPKKRLKYVLVITEGISISSNAIHFCSNAHIPIDFLDIRGQPTARLSNPHFPQLRLGLAQLDAFQNGKAKFLAKTFVEGKAKNQLNLMKYFNKYRKSIDPIFHKRFKEERKRIETYIKELEKWIQADHLLEESRNQLFSIEGRVASSYWELVKLIVQDEVAFEKRRRKGATDLFNSLLNYGYGILYSRIWGSILRAGLNPEIGFLHKNEFHRPTLVFDLIEEFRAPVVDRVIISMIGRDERFELENGFLSIRSRRKLAQNILERLNIPIHYKQRERSLSEIIRLQSKALADFLIGKRKKYIPYIAKW